jgi:hypothetical protein
MSEFGDQDDELEGPVAAKPAGRPVGELESIDSLLGEDSPQDRGGRPRGGRRRR